jgi:hypothetical protein
MSVARATGQEAVGTEPLSEPPGTVRPAEVDARLAPGAGRLRIALTLAAGEKLAKGAPSQFRVIPVEGSVTPEKRGGPIAETQIDIPLRAEEGKGKLRVQAHYYYCANEAACSVRTVSWTVNVTVAAGGAGEIALEDRPLPTGK